MQDLKLIVAGNITSLRNSLNMTQAELGEKLNYSDKSISKWERGEAIPDVRVLKEMADIFHVTVDYLITDHEGEELPAPDPVQMLKRNYSTDMIMLVTIAGIFGVALLIFVLLWIFMSKLYWMCFVVAVPPSIMTWLILNSIWHRGKHNFIIIALFVASIVAMVYLIFLSYNLWQLFLLLIPAELIVFLSFQIKIRRKKG